MTGPPDNLDAHPALSDNAAHDPERVANRLQNRALLDVYLHISRNRVAAVGSCRDIQGRFAEGREGFGN